MHTPLNEGIYMKKCLVTLALAAVSALLLSACNGPSASGPSGMGPLPAKAVPGRVHHADNGVTSLHAGGADYTTYVFNGASQPVGFYYDDQPGPAAGSLFASAGTQGTIYYCSASSTEGREAFEDYKDSSWPPTGPCAELGQTATGFGGRVDPLDFVSSATALPSTECCSSSSPYYESRDTGSETWGQPFEFPEVGGPISIAYDTSSYQVNPIKLSTWTYCAIANGTISDWNDSAITADNGGNSVTGGVSETIDFYFRADSASTTNVFTTKLNNTVGGCNQTFSKPYNAPPYASSSRSAAWTFGISSTWPGPGSTGDPNSRFTGEQQNEGIVNAIQGDTWGTGYVDGAAAAAAPLGQASLQNGIHKGKPWFVNPTNLKADSVALTGLSASDIQYGEGSDGKSLGSSTPWCQLYVPSSDYVNPSYKGYPIVGIDYMLFYGKNNGVHLSDKKKLVTFLLGGKATSIIKSLEYTPVPASLHSAVKTALKGKGSQSACLQ